MDDFYIHDSYLLEVLSHIYFNYVDIDNEEIISTLPKRFKFVYSINPIIFDTFIRPDSYLTPIEFKNKISNLGLSYISDNNLDKKISVQNRKVVRIFEIEIHIGTVKIDDFQSIKGIDENQAKEIYFQLHNNVAHIEIIDDDGNKANRDVYIIEPEGNFTNAVVLRLNFFDLPIRLGVDEKYRHIEKEIITVLKNVYINRGKEQLIRINEFLKKSIESLQWNMSSKEKVHESLINMLVDIDEQKVKKTDVEWKINIFHKFEDFYQMLKVAGMNSDLLTYKDTDLLFFNESHINYVYQDLIKWLLYFHYQNLIFLRKVVINYDAEADIVLGDYRIFKELFFSIKYSDKTVYRYKLVIDFASPNAKAPLQIIKETKKLGDRGYTQLSLPFVLKKILLQSETIGILKDIYENAGNEINILKEFGFTYSGLIKRFGDIGFKHSIFNVFFKKIAHNIVIFNHTSEPFNKDNANVIDLDIQRIQKCFNDKKTSKQ